MRKIDTGNKNLVYRLKIVYNMFVVIAMIGCKMPTIGYFNDQFVIENEPVIEKPIIIIEEEIIVMELKPIKEYEKYAVSESGKVYGLKGLLKELITPEDTEGKLYPFNNFFVLDGTIFFNISVMERGDEVPESDPVAYESVEKIYYFFQTGGEISEDTKTAFPKKPESKRVEMGISPWSIVTGDYKGTPISTIKQEISTILNPTVNFLFIDGYYSVNDGLWFSVPEGVENTAIKKGLYFWGINNKGITPKGEYCRIW